MNKYIIFLLLLAAGPIYSQKYCHCDSFVDDTWWATCDTTVLKSNARFYRLFDCEGLYWKLESLDGKQEWVSQLEASLAWYPRLNTLVFNDGDSSVLRCMGCSGGFVLCSYSIWIKSGLRVFASFSDLVYDDDSLNLVIYMSAPDSMKLYDLNQNKVHDIPYPVARFNASLPEVIGNIRDLIEDHTVSGSVLLLTYRYVDPDKPGEWQKDILRIDLEALGIIRGR